VKTVAEELVGRAGELATLDAALGELARGGFGALEVLGDPGIGKTRLLAELAERADARGQLVLSGAASELEHELPFGVFVDALDDYVEGLPPRSLEALDEGARAELAHVLPALDGDGAVPVSTLQQERYRTHRAVRQLLEALAELRPLVLLLDDLHWADSGSVELLATLLRRPPAAPVLVGLAMRPRQIPERLSGALERGERTGVLRRLELGALSRDESRALLGPAVTPPVAAALHSESGGNPFYLHQLARSLHRRPLVTQYMADAPSPGGEVPRMVAAALADELALLSAPARRVLEGAAVAGDPFEPELAAAAAAVPEPGAVAALDELLRLDLVRATDVPRRFRFRHPLVRIAVYDAAPGGWRLAAHERSAAALSERGAAATLRAHHVEQAARHGDAAAVAVLREAGEATAARSPAGAARWFGAALRLLPETAPPAERIGLLGALARALAATGRFDEARAAVLDSLALVPAGAAALRAQLTAQCAGIEQLQGRHDDARARLERALDELEDPASREAAALMTDLAVAAFYRGDFAGVRTWGTRAREVAAPLGEPPLIAAAAAAIALAEAFVGDPAEADRACTEAAVLIDGMPDSELAVRLDAIAHLAGAECYVERFEAAAAHGERGLALARATGQGELLPMLMPALSTVALALGAVAEGSEMMDGAVESTRLTGNAQGLAWNLLNRALIAMLAGDHDGALRTAEEGVELARTLDAAAISVWAHGSLALVLIDAGEHARGVETLLRHCGGLELELVAGGWKAYYLEHLTRGLLALGRREDAERTAAEAAAVAAATGLRHAGAMAERAAAAVALDTGDAAAAAEHALASAAAADAVGARVEAALARTLAGRALAAAGETERAAEELRRAAQALDACGAVRYRDAAERELGRLGRRRSRRTGAAGIEALTQRELQVARLIVDRRTNPQIAAELYLSQKTVETHIRNLFQKLGVSSRVDVARVVERAERDAEP
jgi:DNA-binding NarL/FixJ family response regulator